MINPQNNLASMIAQYRAQHQAPAAPQQPTAPAAPGGNPPLDDNGRRDLLRRFFLGRVGVQLPQQHGSSLSGLVGMIRPNWF